MGETPWGVSALPVLGALNFLDQDYFTPDLEDEVPEETFAVLATLSFTGFVFLNRSFFPEAILCAHFGFANVTAENAITENITTALIDFFITTPLSHCP